MSETFSLPKRQKGETAAEYRLRTKRSRKTWNRSRYQAWAESGDNSKRAERKRQKIGRSLRTHRVKTRIPYPFHLWVDKEGNLRPGHTHRMWLEWQALSKNQQKSIVRSVKK